jgi:hypothetical protein
MVSMVITMDLSRHTITWTATAFKAWPRATNCNRVQGCAPPSGRKCPCCIWQVFSLVGSTWSNKALVHCTKPKFSPEKKCFFATRKDMEFYSQMTGKRILALEFSNFQTPDPALSFASSGPFFTGCTPSAPATHCWLLFNNGVRRFRTSTNTITTNTSSILFQIIKWHSICKRKMPTYHDVISRHFVQTSSWRSKRWFCWFASICAL